MSQNLVDFTGSDPSGDQLLDDLLTDLQQNFLTNNSGTSRPSYAVAGTLWIDNTTNPWILKIFNGTSDISLGTLNTSTLAWATIPLGTGGILSFNAGNIQLEHSNNTLTLNGTGKTLALGANNLTMTGSLGATGARLTKGWLTDLEVTNDPTINGAAFTAVKRAYTKQQNFNNSGLTDAASIAWNLDDFQSSSVTLGGNRTLANPTNQVAHGTYVLIVKQDATGSRTLAYGSSYKWPGGSAPVLSTAANSIDVLSFVSDGTNMYGNLQKGFA